MGVALGGCGGGSASNGGASVQLDLVEVSNGFGALLPHQVFRMGPNGQPTPEIITIRKESDLIQNVTSSNPVLPVTEWPVTAELPNGDPGNHYIVVRFTHPLAISTVLDKNNVSLGNSGLTESITVVAVDPTTGQGDAIAGRAFVGGKTYAPAPDNPSTITLQKWIGLDGTGVPVAKVIGGAQPGLGFPGTESTFFPGGAALVSPNTMVFVVDTDGDLRTHETFPTGRQIRLRATQSLLSTTGEPLVNQVVASSTVGADSVPPEVALTAPPSSVPITSPSFGDEDVDPNTQIIVTFTEPVQPLSVGPLPTGKAPAVSSSVTVSFGPGNMLTKVPFTALPTSIYDFSQWTLTPVFAFPGSGPSTAQCGTFGRVDVSFTAGSGGVRDLVQLPPPVNGGNSVTIPGSTFFETGEGPGLVNAPVTPDVVYAVRNGAAESVSVIDLNGFGQSTGNPAFDLTYSSFPKGNSNFPNNPNFINWGASLLPPLVQGTCTVNGGSAGVFSLTLDSSLDSRLIRPPLITSASDIMIGHSLDEVFNNSLDQSGCKSGGGNVCALSGLKLLDGGNPVAVAPHPNPPALIFPPLCTQPFIGGAEPTSLVNIATVGPNLLVPGDPFGDPLGNPAKPPTGLLSSFGNTNFLGPDSPAVPVGSCVKYSYRQQIGHFLYLIDRARRELVVLNSNRFTVLDRIQLPDPTDLAMGPNIDFLAVSNQKANVVSFIDINPASSSFHKVVKTTVVGNGPRGIAWDPGNEGLIVCNEDDSSLSLLSAFNFNVRKTLTNALSQPFDVVITQRQIGFGWNRNVYFGWVLNRNGDLSMFESGPSGINGWGYDDVIGTAPFTFDSPQRIIVDPRDLRGSVWVAHENPLGLDGLPSGKKGGALTSVVIDSSISGIIYLTQTSAVNPQFRQMSLKVLGSFGSPILTGVPTDIAMDDMLNASSQPNLFPPQAAGIPLNVNGKSLVRAQVLNNQTTGVTTPSKGPEYMFCAIPNSIEGPGVVDVIKLGSGLSRFDTDPYLPGVQSIPLEGVRILCDYWRQ